MSTTKRPGSKLEKRAAPKAAELSKAAADAPAKAASLLRLGQNLEKTGKNAAALTYYRRIAKLYADTPSAKTADERIKALEPR